MWLLLCIGGHRWWLSSCVSRLISVGAAVVVVLASRWVSLPLPCGPLVAGVAIAVACVGTAVAVAAGASVLIVLLVSAVDAFAVVFSFIFIFTVCCCWSFILAWVAALFALIATVVAVATDSNIFSFFFMLLVSSSSFLFCSLFLSSGSNTFNLSFTVVSGSVVGHIASLLLLLFDGVSGQRAFPLLMHCLHQQLALVCNSLLLLLPVDVE